MAVTPDPVEPASPRGQELAPAAAQAADVLTGDPWVRLHSDTGWRPSIHEVMRRVDVLESAAVFFTQPNRVLHALARRLRRVTLEAGSLIAAEGEPGDTMFFIERGTCQIVHAQSPETGTIAVLNPGDYFGDEACLLERPHVGSAYSLTECSLMALDRTSLYAVLQDEPECIAQLEQVAQQRIDWYAEVIARSDASRHNGAAHVVGVYAARGGSGSTSVALNLVGALAKTNPGQVLLLDLDLPFAHAALLAGLVPQTCLARVGAVPPELFDEALLTAVMYHSGGSMILAGVLQPEEADRLTPELVSRAIAALRKRFRYIVVDLSPVLTEPVLAAVDALNQVVVVTTPDLSSVKSAVDGIDILLELGFAPGGVFVVLNHRSPSKVVDRAAVERLLRRKVDLEIGFDGGRVESAALKGEILSQVNLRSELARAAGRLAVLIEGQRSIGDTGPC